MTGDAYRASNYLRRMRAALISEHRELMAKGCYPDDSDPRLAPGRTRIGAVRLYRRTAILALDDAIACCAPDDLEWIEQYAEQEARRQIDD